MKTTRFLKTVIALILTLTFIALVPLNTAAAANSGKYVSELYIAYGDDEDKAEAVLTGKGFTPVKGDLNDNSDTYVMMGYKTTDDIRESITDIAVMNMDGNFNTTEYTEVLRQRKTQVAELLDGFMATIKEYRANYRDGKAKATAVHDLLNKLTDDDSGMGLGDLFNSETFQDKVGVANSVTAENKNNLPDLLTVLMQGNTYYISIIESLLAVSADTNDNTWVDRFAEKDYDDMLDDLADSRPDLNTVSKQVQYLEPEYGDLVDSLAESAAVLRRDLLEYEATRLPITEVTDDELAETFGDAEQADEDKKAQIVSDELSWLQSGLIYESLKDYEGGYFEKGELLDFFLEEVDEDDTERYYPMAAAFTDGQRGGMSFITFKDLLRYAFMDFDSWKEDIEKNANLNSVDSDSVYKGINRDFFKTDGSIAYTGAATREENISQKDENENEIDYDDPTYTIWLLWGVTAFCGISFGLAKIGMKVAIENISPGRNLPSYSAEEIDRIMTRLHDNYPPAYSDWHLSKALSNIFKFATVFFAIVSAIYTIYTFSQKDEVELKPIPKYFVDNKTTENGESFQLNYQAVECNRADYNGNARQTGSSADLNADDGKQWVAVYVSKNSMAGRPVLPEFEITEDTSAPNGMSGTVHLLGEKGAANLSDKETLNYSRLYSTYRSIKDAIAGDIDTYLFFKLSNTAKTYDESAGNMTASAMGSGTAAVWGFGGLALGAILGVLGAVMINKKKKETA